MLSLERSIDGKIQKADIFTEPVSFNANEVTHVDAPGIFKRSPPSQIEHIDLDRGIVGISCRLERTGTGTVRHYHGANESCRGRNRGIEAYLSNGMGATVQ